MYQAPTEALYPLLRAAGCFQCVSGVSTFLGILVRTRNCNGSQCADPHAHKETAMVRNLLFNGIFLFQTYFVFLETFLGRVFEAVF